MDGNDRILTVLDALVARQREGWGVRELAEAVALSRSTVNRILQGLVERGLASPTYAVGPRLRVLARVLHRRHPLLRGAPAVLDELSRAADATVLLAVHGPAPDAAFIALLRTPPGPIRYDLEPGMRLPLDAGAAGDVISIGWPIPLAAGVAAPLPVAAGLAGSVAAMRLRHDTTDADLERLGPAVREAADALAAIARQPSPAERPAVASGADATALGRVLRLLEVLVAEPSGVPTGAELARRLGANEATAARLRADALAAGLAVPAGERRMAAGPLLLRWAAVLGPEWDVAGLADGTARALARATGETVGLVVYDPTTTTATFAAEARGSAPVEYSLGVGTPIPLYAGAAGKAVLAHCPPEVVRNQSLRPLTPRTPTTAEQLARDLRQIREAGWARAEGERIPDAFGLAAPFFADDGVAGSLTFTIPRFRADAVDVPALTTTLTDAARQVTALLTV